MVPEAHLSSGDTGSGASDVCALRLRSMNRRCGDVLANKNVSLDVKRGEIHAVVGENGAGKSTLLKMAAGLMVPDSGEIQVEGRSFARLTAAEAISNGIGMVQQHFALIPPFTVAENVVLGREPTRNGRFDRAGAQDTVRTLAAGLGFELDPAQRVSELSIGAQQRVEILKLLYRQAKILILDEPTAVLAPAEVDELFELLRAWVKQGRTVILVTHKLREVMAIADRVTVMRRGEVVACLPIHETSVEDLAGRMVQGHPDSVLAKQLADNPPSHQAFTTQAMRLNLRQFAVQSSVRGQYLLEPLELSLAAGEILGVAGVQGNGQTELVEALAGLIPFDGEALLEGQSLRGLDIEARQAMGLAHIPEDRQAHGLVLNFSIRENMALGRLANFSRRLWRGLRLLQETDMESSAQQALADYDIRPPDTRRMVGSLSGGNQQKVVVARELQRLPKVLLASQPTRGVDIGAMKHIHDALLKARSSGTAILLVSADLQELISLSDRIAVLYRGRVMGILSREEATEQRLGALMLGSQSSGRPSRGAEPPSSPGMPGHSGGAR